MNESEQGRLDKQERFHSTCIPLIIHPIIHDKERIKFDMFPLQVLERLTALTDVLDEGELDIPIIKPDDELTEEPGDGISSSSSLLSDGDLANSAAKNKHASSTKNNKQQLL